MPKKTTAEICKAYRERKKASLGEQWLQKERDRVRKYYVPVSELTESQLKKRRKEGRESMALLHNRKKKEEDTKVQPSSDQRTTRSRAQHTPQLTVKLDFRQHSSDSGQRTRKRVSRAVSRAHRQIESLKSARDKLTRKTWRLQKKIQRMKEKCTIRRKLFQPMTPEAKAERDMKKVGLDPAKYTNIKQKLIAHYALLAEMKQKVSSGSVHKRDVQRCLTGRIVKKYRILRMLGRETHINRNKLNKKFTDRTKRRQPQARLRVKNLVHHFYERDDVSRLMPGKRDAVKLAGQGKIQARVLTDYLRNLWVKFSSENPSIHLSLSLFCKLRPGHVKLTSFTSRQTCLCVHHQNMALMLKALNLSNSPDACVKEYTDEEMLNKVDQLEVDNVHYHTWKSVEADGRTRTKCIPVAVSKIQFKEKLKHSLQKFRDHVERIASQYKAISTLKSKLSSQEVVIQMDFSENFTCKSLQEVQSAYWSQVQVSLHPVVIYFKEKDQDLKYKSYVFISGDTTHNSSAVITIMKKLNNIVKEAFPSVKMVHFIMDSPVSQYRNRTIFHILGNYQTLFGLQASWTYHESGHGKGPCDGVGGVLKRQASEAVRQGKAVIQDADEFFAWATSTAESSKTSFFLYTEEEVQATSAELNKMDCKQIKGTMELHAILPMNQGEVAFRKTSCFDDCCYQYDRLPTISCPGWSITTVGLERTDVAPLQYSDITDGSWIAAMYQDQWYLGHIIEVDHADHLYLVNFLEKTPKGSPTHFRWPRRPDLLWRSLDEVICVIPPPKPTQTARKIVEISVETLERIKGKYYSKD